MAIPGNWQIHFDWGCTGTYLSVGITFDPGGTWNSGIFNGQWVELNGEVIFNFVGLATVYAGNVSGGAAVGIMSTFSGSNGCWYMVKQDVPAAKAAAPSHDLAGKPAR
ncbi:MAG: hypothetical protein ACJ76N_02060 [Thermoanaerobaculia bacterium]